MDHKGSPSIVSNLYAGQQLGRPRCLFINTCYEKFLLAHYQRHPSLLGATYAAQLQSINSTFFGDSDFYSKGLNQNGIESFDVIANCHPSQMAWAAENGFNGDVSKVLYAQIEALSPDIVYIQDIVGTPIELLKYLRQRHTLIVGQIACEMAVDTPISAYDIIFTSFLHYVRRFRAAGITSYYSPLAFSPDILEVIPAPEFQSRPIACSFIGGISAFHHKGTELLQHLVAHTPLEVWGYGKECLPPDSLLSQRHRGEAWGQDMFRLFTNSRITVNRHSEAASTNVNNMRLFEATGCGCLLITDYGDNLNDLFEIGKEVVAYRSADECSALINYYLNNPAEAERIAKAGQERTLKEHTYSQRMRKVSERLLRHINYQRNPIPIPDLNRISCEHKPIELSAISPEMLSGWKHEDIALSQRGLVQHELEKIYHGETPTPFRVAEQLLAPVVKNNYHILEIGCSSGYYYEALEYLLNKQIAYTGLDYSEAMIAMARNLYPGAEFHVADGANLPLPRRSFDLVISGSVLLHCPNYPAHIMETCRVAERYILLHRTPITTSGPTRFYEKLAYGVKTVELWFNEQELLELFDSQGFTVQAICKYNEEPARSLAYISYLLVRDSSRFTQER